MSTTKQDLPIVENKSPAASSTNQISKSSRAKVAVKKPASPKITTPSDDRVSHGHKRHKVVVALQGGGSHGSFAWGVLDRLLEDNRVDIEGISGTSAGGMNAVSTVQGLLKGGPEEARRTLRQYWEKITALGGGDKKPHWPMPWMMWGENYNLNHHMAFQLMTSLMGMLSPYQMNPFNYNPLRDFIENFIDFDLINKQNNHKLFLAATNVQTGKIKIFSNGEITPDTMMASACLPSLYQAVEIEGEYYWDGGFIANPALYPLINDCEATDIIIIQLTKTQRKEIPITAFDIKDRLSEITFNSCLVREMRMIHFISNLIDKGLVKEGALKRVHVHVIRDEDAFANLNFSSAGNMDERLLEKLFRAGRKSASSWLENHSRSLGAKSSGDLHHLHVHEDMMFKHFV